MSQKSQVANLDLNDMINLFYKHQLKIKTFHFQTKIYGAHKASDWYLKKFEKNFDKFMEVAQGIEENFGKLSLQIIDVKCETLTDDNIADDLTHFIHKILTDIYPKIKQYTCLTTILDEMLGNIHQFKYLLTFK